MGRRLTLGVVVAIACSQAVLSAATAPAAFKPSVSKARLASFRSCTALVNYARRNGARIVESYGIPTRGFAAAPAAPGRGDTTAAPTPAAGSAPTTPEFSGTNVQEAGIDEPDTVKTDGSRIFVANGNTIRVVGVRGGVPRLLATLKLDSYTSDLLLEGNRLLAIGYGQGPYPIPVGFAAPPPSAAPAPDASSPASDAPASTGGGSAGSGSAGPGTVAPAPSPAPSTTSPTIAPYFPGTVLTEIDVSDSDSPKVLRTLQVDGSFIGGRLRGHTARLVISSPPRALDVSPPPGPQPTTAAGRRTRYRTMIKRAGIGSWLPRTILRDARTGRRTHRALTSCRRVRQPKAFSGLGLTTVLTVDMSKGLPAIDSDAVMSDGGAIYASSRRLYVTTQRWVDPDQSDERVDPGASTAVHAFNVAGDDSTTYVGSGLVRGFILNQFSLSERGGFLRIATTEQPPWFGDRSQIPAESFVTVLDEVSGGLAAVGRTAGFGRGEHVFGVRFLDDVGFVVTFLQKDPLHVIDLSNPRAPRLRGELTVAGYSAYLHPIGDDLMIGVGRDADDSGRTRGLALSLFDLSNLDHPRRLQHKVLSDGTSSAAEYDHHAFLYWPRTDLLVLPISQYGPVVAAPEGGGTGIIAPIAPRPADVFNGAVGFRVGRANSFPEVGRVRHPSPDGSYDATIERSLVIGDRLFTVSYLGVRASDLGSFADRGFAAFPQEQQPPTPVPAADKPAG
jgi:hypothetical protein